MDQPNPEPSIEADNEPAETTVAQQARVSVLGEMVGFAVSIGAVYAAEGLAPKQTRAFIDRLAKKLGEWRSTSPEAQQQLARTVADFTIMNVGGIMNMGTQFAVHRHAQRPNERAPLGRELGRLITGRVAGTATAALALSAAKTHMPAVMGCAEGHVGRLVGNRSRFGELAVMNAVQSGGALVGNIPAQLLYDKVLGTDKSRA